MEIENIMKEAECPKCKKMALKDEIDILGTCLECDEKLLEKLSKEIIY